ncbi:uncharacterized protein LOC124292316 [Haliotis rubra]|uniref:uncharacterized protein LOC124292316 n=1 Tax=Haliotis rubra TaxID=36100 RepID=UPI001EE51639|nr:uncharacterized protein LOC124292316 [Haliotis rubra]
MTLVKCCSGKQVVNQECLDSLQRLRTPDHLPMDHNAAQARHQAQQQRHRRHTTVHDVRRASIDSENLRQYSKRRFEFAIKNLSNSDAAVNIFRINDVPRPNTTPHLPTQTCSSSLRTGPTQYGSVLYNRKPLMLSSIRVRPQSEDGKYSHTRGRTNPGIERALHQSNSDYIVKGTPDTRGQTSWPHSKTSRQPSSDLFLIPNGGVREFLPDYGDNRLQENTLDGSTCISSRPEMCFMTSLAARRDGYMADNISETSSGSRHRQQRSTSMTSPLPSQCRWATPNVGNVGRQGDSMHRVNIGRLGRPLTGKWRTGSDCSSSGSLSSDDTSMSERPKCWVDDVTISSDASQHSQEDVEPVASTDNKSNTQRLPATPTEATKTGPQKGLSSQIEGSKINRQKSSPNLIEGPKNTQKVTSNLVDGAKLKRYGSGFINVNEQVGSETVNQGPGELDGDVEDAEKDISDFKDVPENVFPTFVCPSSEKKSRQTALKYWLANTCFSCADRRVPLV